MLTYRTSHVYPQWVDDRLGITPSFYYGNLGPSLGNLATEPISMGAAVASIELRAPLSSFLASDSATLSTSVYQIEFRNALTNYSADADVGLLSASVVSITFDTTLVNYYGKEDSASLSASIVEVSLT